MKKWPDKKGGLIREVSSLEGDNLLVFYCHSASEIWPDRRSFFWWGRPYRKGGLIRQVASLEGYNFSSILSS